MTAIERTAYPRLKQKRYSPKELTEIYTPTPEEIRFAWDCTKTKQNVFCLILHIKIFQRLGYFLALSELPKQIIRHILDKLGFEELPVTYVNDKQERRYKALIREFLNVKSWDQEARKFINKEIFHKAYIMDNPADLINAAIEILVKNRFELPSFEVIDRLIRHIRNVVNNNIFDKIVSKIPEEKQKLFDGLFSKQESSSVYTVWNKIKTVPQRPTLMHLKDCLKHLDWLMSFGDMEPYLSDIPEIKIRHFSAIGKAYTSNQMMNFRENKRISIAICLLYRSQIQTRDDIITMFIKRVGKFHVSAREELETLREKHNEMTNKLLSSFSGIIKNSKEKKDDSEYGQSVRFSIDIYGGFQKISKDCENAIIYTSSNWYPFIWKYYKSHRQALFTLIKSLKFGSTTYDASLLHALAFMIKNQKKTSTTIVFSKGNLDFANDAWRKLVIADKQDDDIIVNRKEFEICVFSCLAGEIKAGDIFIEGSESYGDYRTQLLSWEKCLEILNQYCAEVSIPNNAIDFVENLKNNLKTASKTVDDGYTNSDAFSIDVDGVPTLKKLGKKTSDPIAKEVEELILENMPKRNLLDIVCNTEHWLNWSRHFCPVGGGETRIDDVKEKYIITAFAYGTNLGATETSNHMKNPVSPYLITFINSKHIDSFKLDGAIKEIINSYSNFSLPKIWGSGTSVSADGTKLDIYEDNLLAEYHIRYGGYGGIAYHHVADNYIATFSNFIPCGTWEAIYILDVFHKDEPDMNPDTIYADTQGQSAPVFAFAYLLGIKLMPRIRNWKDLKLFKYAKIAEYKNIDVLFDDQPVDWQLIQDTWQNMVQVILSIREGKISPSMILRKLGNYSRKNKLYKAFRELGRVIRTVFLLEYISDIELRQRINAETNKVESYHRFSGWLFYGSDSTIRTNDPEQQEKIVKYNHLIANAVIFNNIVDLTNTVNILTKQGHKISTESLGDMSPYVTKNIRRFGLMQLDMSKPPPPINAKLEIPGNNQFLQ